MRIEALGHVGGRDPVGEMDQRIGGGRQRVLGQHGVKIAIAGQAVFGQHVVAAAGQQQPRLLERLADRGDAEGLAQRRIGLLHPPAGEDQGTAGEIDGTVAHDHEDLQPLHAIAQQQDGAGRAGRRRLIRHGCCPRG